MSDSKDPSLPHSAAGEASILVLNAVPSVCFNKQRQVQLLQVALNKLFLEIRRFIWRRFAENYVLGSLRGACVEFLSTIEGSKQPYL